MFLNQPISSRREEQTNVLVCATFIMKKQPFILEKRCSFLLADIDIFIDFLVLEKKKTKTCSGDSCTFWSSKKMERNNPKNLIVPFIKFKSAEKEDSFRVCSFYIHGTAHTERCASNKEKVEVWCQYHIRSHKSWKICR